MCCQSLSKGSFSVSRCMMLTSMPFLTTMRHIGYDIFLIDTHNRKWASGAVSVSSVPLSLSSCLISSSVHCVTPFLPLQPLCICSFPYSLLSRSLTYTLFSFRPFSLSLLLLTHLAYAFKPLSHLRVTHSFALTHHTLVTHSSALQVWRRIHHDR